MAIGYSLNNIHKVLAHGPKGFEILMAFFDGEELSDFVLDYDLDLEDNPRKLLQQYVRRPKTKNLPEGYSVDSHCSLHKIEMAGKNYFA